MLDTRFVLANLEQVRRNCELRGCDVDLDEVVRLCAERGRLTTQVEGLRHETRVEGRSLGAAPSAQFVERAKARKAEQARLAQLLREVERDLQERVSYLPNMLDPRVPVGGDESNQVVRTVGDPPHFAFQPRSHQELGELLRLIDSPRGAKLAKSRFYCLKNQAVRLRLALVRMFWDHLSQQGFQMVSPPVLAKEETLYASGYLPFARRDNFRMVDEDLSLIGTSEQALLGMHIDEILEHLPLLYLGDSMCFRTEAGSYGRDTTGILRVHQFYKLEQFVYCHPDESEKWHLQCLENEEWLLRELDIHYRVVITASEDLAAPGRLKYDTEAWFPAQATFREVTSNTNLTDYQTRRGRIRFKMGSDRGFPHTISATGFCDRLIAVIMENYQCADGGIRIPDRLVAYMDGLERIERIP